MDERVGIDNFQRRRDIYTSPVEQIVGEAGILLTSGRERTFL